MKQDELARLSFADLRDRLKAGADQPGHADDFDLHEVLRYLIELPDEKHVPESVDALVQLARNFHFAGQPSEALQAASNAARLAVALEQKSLLCAARGIQGVKLGDLGYFAEATVAQVECWSLARALEDRAREIQAITNFGILVGAMGQYEVAMQYFERSWELAEEHGYADCELLARSNFAVCALELRQPASGLRALSQLKTVAPQTRQDVADSAVAHNNLAHLHILAGDLNAARVHAQESARLAKTVQFEKLTPSTEAVLGLIDVWSGEVETGLSALEGALSMAKRVENTEVLGFLGMCIDAYEAAGHPDKALEYLNELVASKKKSIDAEVMPLQYDGFPCSLQLHTGFSHFDDGLLAKAHLLQAGVQDRIQRLVEMAVNAEIAGGHDLYRTFRVAKLARYLGATIGWDEQHIHPLVLGAQLCNIGMMAVPTRILQKSGGLSGGEHEVLRDHTRYGSELLRKSKLRILDVATLIAEEHHERFDGSGYPRGLSGDAIAEEARIVSICDTFDAMTHRRPWRATPLSNQEALDQLKQGAGSQFDPILVNAFVDLVRGEFRKHDDLEAFLAEGADEFEYVRARARMDA
ncbi:MAG: HD domain-containing protein, partial [Pyrinomonadaceae bacterium]|nr:HD domain-containing protein [Pyrinomonadaceae bacterium]